MEAQSRIVPAFCVLHNTLVNIGEIDLEQELEDLENNESEDVQEVQQHRGYAITPGNHKGQVKKETSVQRPCAVVSIVNPNQPKKSSQSESNRVSRPPKSIPIKIKFAILSR